jgi:hypothetical protein
VARKKNILGYIDAVQLQRRITDALMISDRVSLKKKKFRFQQKQTETRSVSVVFQFVSRNQKNNFGLFRFVSVFQNYIEITELFQYKQKQLEIPKYALYETDQVGFSSIETQKLAVSV